MPGWSWGMMVGDGMICCKFFSWIRRSCILTILRPFFRRTETFHTPSSAHQEQYGSSYQAEFNGSTGPVQTTHRNQYMIPHQYWHPTLNKLGVSSNADGLSGSNVGVWNFVTAVDPDRQERSYSASAYYEPVSGRANLHLLTESIVTEILLAPTYKSSGWLATGARVRCGEKELAVKATKEVILSGGSVNSPQLLELSGIGKRDVLQAAGIPVKVHNPNVGENLQEHISMHI